MGTAQGMGRRSRRRRVIRATTGRHRDHSSADRSPAQGAPGALTAPSTASSSIADRLRNAGPIRYLWARLAAGLRLLDTVPQGTKRPPSLWWLLRIGALIEVCFLGLIVVTPLGGLSQSASPLVRAWPWLLAPARLFFPGWPLHVGLAKEHNKPAWPAAVFSALLIVAAVAAAVAVWRCLRQQGSRGRHLALALVGAAIMGATLALLPSDPSDDIFSYIIYGRIAVIHHANPLVTTPASFPHDPFFAYVYWQTVRSVYGPVWLLVSGGLTQVAEMLGGGLATYVLLFKLLGV